MPTNINVKTKVTAFLNAAVTLQQVGEFKRAIVLLEDACKMAPDYVPVHLSLGLAYQATSKYSDAEVLYRKAVELEPENSQALKAIGLFLISQGRATESLVWLKKYCELIPQDFELLDVFINALVSVDRKEEAHTVLDSAWQQTRDPDIGLRYTRYLFAQGRPEDARSVIEQVCKVKETPQILAELALSQVVDEHPEQAVQSLLRAIKFDENFDRAWRGLAQCYTQMGQDENALEAAEHALAINPRHYRNWQAKADALILAEKYAEALDAIQAGMQLIRPEDIEAQPVLAVLYFQRFRALLNQGRLDESLNTLARGRELFPKDERFYGTAAQLCQQTGHPKDGLAILDEAEKAGVTAGGRFTPIRYMLLHQMGRSKEAWNTIKGQLKTRKQSRMETLIETGVQLYSTGYYEAARNIFEQLVAVVPDDIRLRTNLGFMLVGEGALEQAESHFTQVITCCSDDYFGLIAHCNLGFVRILQNRLVEAQGEFEKVLSTANTDQDAILRVAFLWRGQIIPDYAPYPNRSIKLLHAARIHMIAIALAQGDLLSARVHSEALQTSCPELLLSEVQACIQMADNQPAEVKKALERALETVEVPAEQQMLSDWLSGLK